MKIGGVNWFKTFSLPNSVCNFIISPKRSITKFLPIIKTFLHNPTPSPLVRRQSPDPPHQTSKWRTQSSVSIFCCDSLRSQSWSFRAIPSFRTCPDRRTALYHSGHLFRPLEVEDIATGPNFACFLETVRANHPDASVPTDLWSFALACRVSCDVSFAGAGCR